MRRFPLSVWIFALALAAFTSLPYLVGQINTPAGWAYSGAAVVPAGAQVDFNSHLAKMWQGYRGEWAYHLLFTHEAHPGLPLVQGFYVALGALARLTPFSLPLVYHIARFALTVGMVLAIWAFAARFFQQSRERWLALLFGTLVTGVSWVLLAIDPAGAAQVSPIEFWLTDAYNPLGALYMPHFAAAVILQLVAFLTFEAWVELPSPPAPLPHPTGTLRSGEGRKTGAPVTENEPVVGQGLRPSPTVSLSSEQSDVGAQYIAPLPVNKRGVGLLILTLALAAESLIQPYVILLTVPLLGILTAYHIFNSKKLTFRRALGLLIPFGVHAALVGYQYIVLSGDPVWAEFTRQNITLSPLVTYYLLGYLPFIIPAAAGLRRFMISEADDRWWLPLLWVGLVAGLLYAPFPTQRRYLLGVQTPLAVIAAYGWSRAVLPWLRPRLRLVTTALYFAVTGFAFIGLVLVNSVSLSKPERADPPTVFYTADEVAAYRWLMDNRTTPDELVLTTADMSGHGSGGRLVAATGQRVYLGHWIETVDFSGKIAQVRRFYDPATPDSWRQDFLREIGAVYVWYDAYAQTMGDWNPADADYLQAVFNTNTVTVFRVRVD
ncbi:MAG: hypothetical protein K8I60_03775 [Anaerolineae bacterium]|nr:hypothetical protein [Anaerolineae bacterium]